MHVFASLTWHSTVSSPGEFRITQNKATPVLCCCFIQALLWASQVGQQQRYRSGQPCFTKSKSTLSSTTECRAASEGCQTAIGKTCSVTVMKNYFCYTTDLLGSSLQSPLTLDIIMQNIKNQNQTKHTPPKPRMSLASLQNLPEKLCVIHNNAISMVLNSTMAKQQVENRAFVYTHRIPTHPYFETASQGPRGEMKGWMPFFFLLQREFLHLSIVNYVQATSKIIILPQKKKNSVCSPPLSYSVFSLFFAAGFPYISSRCATELQTCS